MELTIKQVEADVPPMPVSLPPPLEIWRDHGGAVYAYGTVADEVCWMHVPGIASFSFNKTGATTVDAAVAKGAETPIVLDAYRRRVLPMALQVRGIEILHASAVRFPKGIVGLCGVSQTGKSTIAFALGRRGHPVWCDDALALDISDGKPTAISVPFELKLRPPAVELFGSDVVAESTPRDTIRKAGAENAPLAALFLLRRASDRSLPVVVRRLSFADAFLGLLGNGCWFTFQEEPEKRRVIDHYMDLAAQVPTFSVNFKPGAEFLPEILDAIESASVSVNGCHA